MKKVFIASRFSEEKILKIRRKLAEELININIEPIDLNDNMAVSQPPLDRSLENVRKSDIVLLLLGDTYGTLPSDYNKSYTHLEYEEALKYKDKVKTYVFGIGELYQGGEIQFSKDENMRNWQKEILDNSTIGAYSEEESVEAIVHGIIMNIYREENKVWFDEDTGLMWQVQVEAFGELGGRYFWKDIFKYADDLNRSRYEGYDDWRVPTIDELKTLLTETGYANKYSYDNETYIKKPLLYSMTMEHARFWSSTTSQYDDKKAYGVHFGRRRKNSQSENKGKDKRGKTRYVRCVRLWQDSELDDAWGKIDQNDIESINGFLKKYPNSKYDKVGLSAIKKVKEEYEAYINSMSPLEQKLHKLFEDTSTPKSTLLLKAIEEGVFDIELCEILEKLKELMNEEGTWKESTNAKNPEKDKKYQRTIKVQKLMDNCK